MSLDRLVPVFAPLLATLALACTAAPTVPAGDDEGDEAGDESNVNSKPAGSSSTPTPAPTTTPTQAPTTAPTPAPSGSTPAPPNAQPCAQLGACCGTLQDSYDKYACMGVAMYNEPSYCQPALVVCQGGGVGLSGAFTSILGGASGGGAGCTDLSRCCQQMTQRGDALANQCNKFVTANDANQCASNLTTYRQQGKCN